jgi:hypothetical protein
MPMRLDWLNASLHNYRIYTRDILYGDMVNH